jgi:hypothetical protein
MRWGTADSSYEQHHYWHPGSCFAWHPGSCFDADAADAADLTDRSRRRETLLAQQPKKVVLFL